MSKTKFSVRKWSGVVVVLAFLSANAVHAGNNYSHGFRMGQLAKFSVKGLINKSGEGELMMGNESTPWIVKEGDIEVTKNPWAFSALPDMYKALESQSGQYVYIEYDQSVMRNPLARNTVYYAVNVSPVQPEVAPKNACEDGTAKGNYSKGFRVGRIAKASHKGLVNKSYEIIVQVGNAGANFIEMTIQSEGMFNCAVEWLKAGRKVRVDYLQRFIVNGFTRDSSYDVQKLSPASGLQE